MGKELRAAFYIDGYNLFYGIKDNGWKQFYWLDLEKLCYQLISGHQNQKLAFIKYFTARVTHPPAKVKKQSNYIEAIQTRPLIQVIEGKFLRHRSKPCKVCGNNFTCSCKKVINCKETGNRKLINKSHYNTEEKMTDVNIAVNMLADAYDDKFDILYLISGDTDLVPPLKMIKEKFPEKRIIIFFPPKRSNEELKNVSTSTKVIFRKSFRTSQLENPVVKKIIQSGKEERIEIYRPEEWK